MNEESDQVELMIMLSMSNEERDKHLKMLNSDLDMMKVTLKKMKDIHTKMKSKAADEKVSTWRSTVSSNS